MSRQTRTTEEVFNHHVQALVAGNLSEILVDYTENSVLITPQVVAKGKDAIRGLFEQLFKVLPGVTLSAKTVIVEEEIVFVEWTADSQLNTVPDGVDTFVIRDGYIQAQTAKFTLVPKA